MSFLETNITPAQRVVLSIIDENGAAFVSNRTNRSSNEVHVSAATALVRKGVCAFKQGADGRFVQRVRPDKSDGDQ